MGVKSFYMKITSSAHHFHTLITQAQTDVDVSKCYACMCNIYRGKRVETRPLWEELS